MSLHPMSAHLESLGWHIDRFGIDAVSQQHLNEVRHTAEALGVQSALVEVLTDETAPAPVRSRAFGRIATLISRHLPHRAEPTVTNDQVVCAA